MTVTEFEYRSSWGGNPLTELPDKNGALIKVGDRVRWLEYDDFGFREGDVKELSPREQRGSNHTKSGILDRVHSNVVVVGDEGGEMTWSLPGVEKVELSPGEEHELRIRQIDIRLCKLDQRQAEIDSTRRQLERERVRHVEERRLIDSRGVKLT